MSRTPDRGLTTFEAAQKLCGEFPTDEQVESVEKTIKELVELGLLTTDEPSQEEIDDN